jgi:hypothetical protein
MLEKSHLMQIKARKERKKAKRDARHAVRGSKLRDLTMQNYSDVAQAESRLRAKLAECRDEFDVAQAHLRVRHEKELKAMLAKHDRLQKDRKMLKMHEIGHLEEEERASVEKQLQARQTYMR